MKFDARTNGDPEPFKRFIGWLCSETVSSLQRARGDAEAIKGTVFLYLHRAYEAHLEPDFITDLLGVVKDSILNKARLSKEDEETVLKAHEELDPVVEAVYASHNK